MIYKYDKALVAGSTFFGIRWKKKRVYHTKHLGGLQWALIKDLLPDFGINRTVLPLTGTSKNKIKYNNCKGGSDLNH